LSRHFLGVGATLSGWWQAIFEAYRRLDNRLQIALAFIFILAFYLLPGPLGLIFVPLLALIFAIRLDIGLMVLSFGISFFLAKKSLLVASPSGLELGLFLVVAAALFRLGLQLLQTHRFPQPIGRLRPTDWAAISLLLLAGLATVTALNFGVAMYELRTLIIGSITFYFLLRFVPWLEHSNQKALALQLTDAFVAGAVFHAGLALIQYFVTPEQTIDAEGVRRALGYFYGSPNNLSLFLDRAFPVLLSLVLFDRTGPRRWWYALGLIIVSAALFLTYSKGTLLLVVPAIVLFFALTRGGRTGWLGAGSGLILLGYALIPLSRTERFQSTFSLQPGSTTFFRLKVWQSGWEMLQDYPLTGVGLDNFLYAYRTRYILPDAWQEPNLSHPHNLILDFGTRLGVGGILIVIWLLWQFWSGAIKIYRRLTDQTLKALLLGLMGSMLAFIVHGLIDNSFFLVDLAYTFFLSLGLVELLRSEAADSAAKSE
jgi:O-antigen ligase